MYYILIFICIFAIIAFIANKKKTVSTNSSEATYELIESIFTPAERSFYGVLKQVVGGETEIFAKVRVADILKPSKDSNKSTWQTAFNKISRKHFDFILCNKNDLSVICCIELNDQSHKIKSRKERDNFLSSACSSANLPLVMVDAQSNYSLVEIREKLSAYIAESAEVAKPELPIPALNQNKAEEFQHEKAKVCPKCSAELVKRVAKKGEHVGKEFWACSAYPKCKHIEQTNA